MKYYTTIEQSKKLLELGLNPKSADMYYFLDPTPLGNIYTPSLMFIEKHLKSRIPEYDEGDIPCWSLGALTEISKVCTRLECHLRVDKKWNFFATCKDDVFNPFYTMHYKGYNSQLEAYYDLVCWLLENNYIEK